jgi:D-cysteine desulfhydrase
MFYHGVGTVISDLWKGTNETYICPTGATTPLSTIGYVNAMYELKDQIDQNKAEVPSRIYVPAGSSGTFLGIMIGCKAIDMFKDTKIIAVRSGSFRPLPETLRKFNATVKLLVELTNSQFPNVTTTEAELEQITDEKWSGKGYGHSSPEGNEAEELLIKDSVKLEGTYTGKTMAKMIDDARKFKGKGESWLFWNTNSSSC